MGASLWISALCGFIIDLLSSQYRFGIYGLNYCLTALFIYHQNRHFFEDKPLALSLYTAAVSCTSTVLQIILLYAFDKTLPFTLKLAITDLIGMPLVDAVYAFLWFTCPVRLYYHIKRVGWRSIFKLTNE